MNIELLLVIIPLMILSLVSTAAIIYFVILYIKTNKENKKMKNPVRGDIEYTNLALSIVDDTIKQEIAYKMRNNIFLNERYDIKKFDIDLEDVIKAVYNNFSSSFYTDPLMVIKPDALMNYIIKKTSMTFLETIMTYNNNMRSV